MSEGLQFVADEQAALRRVATLVAEEQSPAEVFAKVAEEAANVLEKVECALLRDCGDDSAIVVAAQGADMSARFPVGTQLPTEGEGVLGSAPARRLAPTHRVPVRRRRHRRRRSRFGHQLRGRLADRGA
jgi:hypothetical protein